MGWQGNQIARDGKITFYSKDQGRDLQVKEEVQEPVPCACGGGSSLTVTLVHGRISLLLNSVQDY